MCSGLFTEIPRLFRCLEICRFILGGGGMGSIPLVDLGAQQSEVAAEDAACWQEILDLSGFCGCPRVGAFESEYPGFIGSSHCVGVGNGTDAIEIALRAFGVGPGDEGIIPANTFIATAEA